jgi:glycosyltransferase involved in cell wall biosynthesis
MAGVVQQAQALGYRVIVDQDRLPASQVLRDASNHWAHWIRLPEAWRDLYYERRRCERAHAVVASSPLYAARALKLAPHAHVRVVSQAVDYQAFESLRNSEGKQLVFCGDLEDPIQQQGVHWFAEEVLPRLRAALKAETPEVLVAGPAAPREFLEKLSKNGIHHLTWDKSDPQAASESMRLCLQNAMICFLPHRERKAGFQFLLQSMAAGRPVVSTACSSEGLLFTPGRDIWMDDKPDAFTSAMLKLIRDPELRQNTATLATEMIRRHYDWNSARESLAGLLREL